MQDVRVYSNDGLSRGRMCGYILTMQSSTSHTDLRGRYTTSRLLNSYSHRMLLLPQAIKHLAYRPKGS
eukprot:8972550-Pyramimonas_sp.AAC.1